jgi:hypothetical protein
MEQSPSEADTHSLRGFPTVYGMKVHYRVHNPHMNVNHNNLVSKREGKKPLWRPRCRSGNNIKMDLKEIECECGMGSSGSE